MANLQTLQVSKPFSKALRIILSLVQEKNLRQGEMEIHIRRETSLLPSCPLISNVKYQICQQISMQAQP